MKMDSCPDFVLDTLIPACYILNVFPLVLNQFLYTETASAKVIINRYRNKKRVEWYFTGQITDTY